MTESATKARTITDRVDALLRERGPLSVAEISAALEANSNTVRGVIVRLRARGRVFTESRGRYAASSSLVGRGC